MIKQILIWISEVGSFWAFLLHLCWSFGGKSKKKQPVQVVCLIFKNLRQIAMGRKLRWNLRYSHLLALVNSKCCAHTGGGRKT